MNAMLCLPSRLSLTLMTLVGLELCFAGCSKSVTCGTGTVLDDQGTTCVSDSQPDFNRVIDTVALGNFSISDLDVPDTMLVGKTYTRTFTITNTTDSNKPLTFIRLGMVDNLANNAVQTYFTRIRSKGRACTQTCASANDGVCSDTDVSTAADACPKGSDCGDCPPRKSIKTCNQSAFGYSCSDPGFSCDRTSVTCHLTETGLAAIYIENLAAGESRKITYKSALPQDWDDATYANPKTVQLFLSVNEVKLTKDKTTGLYVRKTSDITVPGERNLERAEAVALLPGTTQVSLQQSADLQMLSAKPDQSSFQLDFSSGMDKPILVVNTRFQTIGKDYGDYDTFAHLTFKLKMPGHAKLDGSYKSSNPPANDPNRTFDLYTKGRDGVIGSDVSVKPACSYFTGGCKSQTFRDPNYVALSQGEIKTGTFKLFLKPNDVRTLAETLTLRSANPSLNSNDELPGTIEVRIDKDTPSDDPSLTNNSVEFPVVLVPPPASRDAAANDSNEPAPSTPTADTTFGPYPEKDNLTPTLYQTFGNDWLGATLQVKMSSSKDRLYQAVTKQYVSTNNFVRLSLLQDDYDLLKITGVVDWSSRRGLSKDIATGDVKVLGLSAAGVASGVNTLLGFDFDYNMHCKKDDAGIERCMLIDGADDPSDFGQVSVQLIPNKVSVSETWEVSKEICDGPMCFTAGVDLTGEVGVQGTVGLFRDKTKDPLLYQGFQVSFGPFADLTGTAFGELSVHLATIALVGEVNLLHVDMSPTVQVGLLQELDDVNMCWKKNTGAINFTGPATLESLSGDVKIDAYLGEIVDLGFVKINLRKLIYEFILTEWPAQQTQEWNLWSAGNEFLAGPGVCPGVIKAAYVWKTPMTCIGPSGGKGYCPNSIPSSGYASSSDRGPTVYPVNYTGAYMTRLYTAGNQCGHILLNGSTEVLRDAEGSIIGDAVNMKIGPGNTSDDVTLRIDSASNCLREEQVTGLETTSSYNQASGRKGRVGCGVVRHKDTNWWDSPGSSAYNGAVNGPFSGDFKNTTINFCNNSTTDDLRYIDVWLYTDGAGNRETVSAKLVPDEGDRSTVRSNTAWWQTYALSSGAQTGSKAWNVLAYDKSGGTDSFTKAVAVTAPVPADYVAPFTQADLDATKWIWGDPVCVQNQCDDTKWGGSTRYFRRAFIATQDSYTVRLRCAECTVYLDGNQVGSNFSELLSSSQFTINTQKGAMHLLSIQANIPSLLGVYNPSAKGVHFMMK